MWSLIYDCTMRLVFMLYLNIDEVSQAEFKFMEVGMLNTEVPVPSKQLFWVLKDRQFSLKISILRRIKHLLFSKFEWVVVGFFWQIQNSWKVHIDTSNQYLVDTHIRKIISSTYFQQEWKILMFPDKTWEYLIHKQKEYFCTHWLLTLHNLRKKHNSQTWRRNTI